MEKSRKKISGGFKAVFGLTIFNFVAFVALFVVFGLLAAKTNDADIKGGILDVLRYHFSDIKGLFTFNFHEGSNVIYFSLTGFLYFLIFIALLYLVCGIVIMAKKKRAVVIPGIINSVLVVVAFIIVATGLPKYWLIIKQTGAFEDAKALMAVTFALLLVAVLYGLTSYILYFYGLQQAYANPASIEQAQPKEEQAEEEMAENTDEDAVMFEEINLEEQQAKPVNNDELIESLKEVIRDIVRDELARNNANQNLEPKIIQNFYGVSKAAPIEEVKEEPVVEEPVAEPQPEPAPAPVVAPVEEPAGEKKPIIRIPFTDRMLSASFEMQKNYNELKNEIMSYGVNSRVSNSGDTFRLHRQTFVKITIAGLSLKLYFALDPNDYLDSTLPIQNAGHKGIYEETPLVFKVKSGLSMRRCKQLIQDVFEKNGMEQGVIDNVDWVKELQNSLQSED